MEIGKSSVPFQLRFDPLDVRGAASSPEDAARRALVAQSSRRVMEGNQRALMQGLRVDTQQRARAPLFGQVAGELSALRSRMSELTSNISAALQAASASSTSTAAASGAANAVASVTSGFRLNLGNGEAVEEAVTTTTTTVTTFPTPAPVENTLDPNATLASQPFTSAITAGTVNVQFVVNGSTTSRSVTIDPTTQSLNQVLSAFSNLALGSGVKPLTASYDAATGNVRFEVAGTSGTNFDFTFTGGTSNFVSQLGGDSRTTSRQVTFNAAITNSTTNQNYYNLTVNVEGVGSATASNLRVSSAGLSLTQKVDELVTQINAQISGLGVTAVNAGGGKLGFTTSDTSGVAAAPNLGVTFSQTNPGGALRLGIQSGMSTTARFVANPDLTEYQPPTPAPIVTTTTTTTNVNTVVGGALGSAATLDELAGQLGLEALNDRFELAVNGRTLSFDTTQSLDEVLAGITNSGAGVRASFDPDSQRITVESTDGSQLAIADRGGNLAKALGIAVEAPAVGPADVVDDFVEIARAIQDVTSLVNEARNGTGLENEALLQDLQAALGGLFNSSLDGRLEGLGDVGITLDGSGLRIDRERLQQLAATRPEELASFVGTFFGERAAPLLRAGEQALQDAGEVAAAESRAAAQAVRVRGEIARLQTRQQMLLLERLNFENARKRVERQDQAFERLSAELRDRLPDGLPDESKERQRFAERVAEPRKIGPQIPITPPGAAPALTSFGLANDNIA